MNRIGNIEELVERIVGDLGSTTGQICIDGIGGVGKTPVAELLASRLGARVISLDYYLNKSQNCYVDALKEELSSELASNQGTTIIEGLCLLEVAHKFNFKPDSLIYLKRTRQGTWLDKDTCEFTLDPEQIIQGEEDRLYKLAEWQAYSNMQSPPDRQSFELPGFKQELIHYHASYQPHNRAQLVYEIEQS